MLRMYTCPLTDEYLYYASILTAKRQVFIHIFKSNTLQKQTSKKQVLKHLKKRIIQCAWKANNSR